jgi:hypothetical protein
VAGVRIPAAAGTVKPGSKSSRGYR